MYREIPAVAKKAAWALKYTQAIGNPQFQTGTTENDQELLQNLIAFYCVLEGLFFYCGFSFLIWLITSTPKFTCIDSSRRMYWNCSATPVILLRRPIDRICENPQLWTEDFQAKMTQMILEGLALEIEYARDTMPRGVLGMNAQMMEEYLKFITNRRLTQIGLSEQFPGAENPFPWMSEIMDLRKEKNFFETRVTEYQVGGALSWD